MTPALSVKSLLTSIPLLIRGAIAKSITGIILLCISAHVAAGGFQLEPNKWESLVIPANPDGRTVSDLLGDDMQGLVFDKDWVVFTFDPVAGDYKRPVTDSMVLEEGRAFWIIQNGAEPIMLDIPADLPASIPLQTDTCASDSGCFVIPLPTSTAGSGSRFDMLGSPYPFDSNLTNARFTTNPADSNCGLGCTFDAANNANYSSGHVWVWNGFNYDEPGVGDVLSPWQGYWINSVSAAWSQAPVLELPYEPTLSTVVARVTTPDGEAISGASVLAASGSSSAIGITDSNGMLSLSLIADTEYLLSFESENYTNQIQRVLSPTLAGSLSLDITLSVVDYLEDFETTTGATLVSEVDGASVTLSPNSFVDAAGQLITGSIVLSMTSIDVSNPAVVAAFPGDFAGMPEGSDEAPIISLGVTSFEFTDTATGEVLQLADGMSADIVIPIFADAYQNGDPIQAGDTIPLWSLNEETGIWEQEGNGTVVDNSDSPTGLALAATVTHFSWWNCDVTMNAVPIQIRVDGSGVGTAQITAVAEGNFGWRPNTVDTIVNVGETTPILFVPNGVQVCYSASVEFSNGSTVSTGTICQTLTSAPAGPIVFTVPDLNAPLGIQASSEAITGYVTEPIERARLSPTSVESSVTYTVSTGALPAGLSIQTINATDAEIVGNPSADAGIYSFTIQGTNGDGDTASVDLIYTISDDAPPPNMVGGTAVIDLDIGINYYDFNVGDFFNSDGPRNTGAFATSWSISPALPEGLVFVDGVIEVLDIFSLIDYDYFEFFFLDWSGTVTATNSAGSSSAEVYLVVSCFYYCFGSDF